MNRQAVDATVLGLDLILSSIRELDRIVVDTVGEASHHRMIIESCLPGIRVCEHLPELPLSDLGRAPRAVQGLPELPYVPFSP